MGEILNTLNCFLICLLDILILISNLIIKFKFSTKRLDDIPPKMINKKTERIGYKMTFARQVKEKCLVGIQCFFEIQ